MYENGKMRTVGTLTDMGEGEIKENDGVGEFNYDIVRTFVNVIMYPLCNNNMITIKNDLIQNGWRHG
jgi:hypothetical protein